MCVCVCVTLVAAEMITSSFWNTTADYMRLHFGSSHREIPSFPILHNSMFSMAPLNVILFALAAASQTSTCNGDDSVSDLCLLQLKGEADTETKAVQALVERFDIEPFPDFSAK